MEKQFICPHCKGHLRVRNSIIFRVRNSKKRYGLMLLHPQIGNYDSVRHPDFELIEGEPLDFYCPICSHVLSTTIDDNLIYVLMKDDQGVEHDIYFSRISGEHSTFQVTGDKVMATGEHAGRYTYFSMSDRFTQYLKR